MADPTLWTAEAAARATDGELEGPRDWRASGVSIDSRTLRPGDLFVALSHARDGHEFVADAFASGAVAALVSRRPENLTENAPLLRVPEVLSALAALGRAGRERSGARVVAVTGSVGKTSTKEMLRAMLSGEGQVHAAEASYNNQWGVPLTLARMPPETRFAVLEIGMNAPGEIAPLSILARPHVVLVTTVAEAHLAAFPDIGGIAREKASIVAGLDAGGTAVLPADLPTTPLLRDAAEAARARIVTFGAGDASDWRLTSVTLTRDSAVAAARRRGEPLLFKVGAPGRHFALNALGALAAAEALGGDIAQAICALGAWSPPGGRGRRETVRLDVVEDQATIELFDDAFNANPASMAAALETLAAAEPRDGVGRFSHGRRIAILGDMLELGRQEEALHAGLAAQPAMAGIVRVHCVGPRMRALHDALPDDRRGTWTETAEEMARRVHHLLDAGDVVLVKGSKGSRVSLVVDAIRKLGQALPNERAGAG